MPTDYARLIRNIPDFPQPGIMFKDITPLLQDAEAYRGVVADMCAPFRDKAIDQVVSHRGARLFARRSHGRGAWGRIRAGAQGRQAAVPHHPGRSMLWNTERPSSRCTATGFLGATTS